MNKVGIREFKQNIYKWFKKLPLIITVHGKPKYEVREIKENTSEEVLSSASQTQA